MIVRLLQALITVVARLALAVVTVLPAPSVNLPVTSWTVTVPFDAPTLAALVLVSASLGATVVACVAYQVANWVARHIPFMGMS